MALLEQRTPLTQEVPRDLRALCKVLLSPSPISLRKSQGNWGQRPNIYVVCRRGDTRGLVWDMLRSVVISVKMSGRQLDEGGLESKQEAG